MVRRADFNFERRDPQEANFRFEKEQPIKAIFKIAPPTVNYELLINKPKINHVELIGDKSLEDLGITAEIIDLIAQHNTSEEAHEFIRNLISQEVLDREAADLLLDGKILQEILDRKAADQTLQNNINEEARVRAEQDLAIRDSLADEARIRTEQDQLLQTNIENEATARQQADQTLDQKITQETQARQQADQVLQTNINNETTARENADTALGGRIDGINNLIPAEASTSNKLADKDYVISNIQTYAASYRGSWATWADVPTDANEYPADVTGSRIPDANDYMIVLEDETQDGGMWRYLYTGTWSVEGKNGWQAEYKMQNSPFTPEQQAAIDSGITSELVGQITTNENDISDINTTMSGYGDIVTHDVSEFATAAQGDLADTAVQPEDLATVATTGDYGDLLNTPTIGNGTITFVQGEETKGTITVNQVGDTTITLDRGSEGIKNLDGGSATSVYTLDQVIDCGGAQD